MDRGKPEERTEAFADYWKARSAGDGARAEALIDRPFFEEIQVAGPATATTDQSV